VALGRRSSATSSKSASEQTEPDPQTRPASPALPSPDLAPPHCGPLRNRPLRLAMGRHGRAALTHYTAMRRRVIEEARLSKLRAVPKALASTGTDVSGFPFLASLAEREEMVRSTINQRRR
jgi:hypothetical protein